jgi:hypothetical protein
MLFKTMGPRLLRLHLRAGREHSPHSRCFDSTLQYIGRHCPNLESFRYGFFDLNMSQEGDFANADTVTGDGVIALLQGCSMLKVSYKGTLLEKSLVPKKNIFPHLSFSYTEFCYRVWTLSTYESLDYDRFSTLIRNYRSR